MCRGRRCSCEREAAHAGHLGVAGITTIAHGEGFRAPTPGLAPSGALSGSQHISSSHRLALREASTSPLHRQGNRFAGKQRGRAEGASLCPRIHSGQGKTPGLGEPAPEKSWKPRTHSPERKKEAKGKACPGSRFPSPAALVSYIQDPAGFQGAPAFRETLLLGLLSGLCLLRPSCGFPCDLGIKSPELGVAWEALPLGPPGALAAPTAPFPAPGCPLRPHPDPATVIIPVLTSA